MKNPFSRKKPQTPINLPARVATPTGNDVIARTQADMAARGLIGGTLNKPVDQVVFKGRAIKNAEQNRKLLEEQGKLIDAATDVVKATARLTATTKNQPIIEATAKAEIDAQHEEAQVDHLSKKMARLQLEKHVEKLEKEAAASKVDSKQHKTYEGEVIKEGAKEGLEEQLRRAAQKKK